MTKDEVLNKNTGTDWSYPSYHSKEDVIAAMDEHAKDMSIAFDQWKHDNGWKQYLGFDTPTFFQKLPVPGVRTYFSSEELYPLFIQSQNK